MIKINRHLSFLSALNFLQVQFSGNPMKYIVAYAVKDCAAAESEFQVWTTLRVVDTS
jgi:hypothetical protein